MENNEFLLKLNQIIDSYLNSGASGGKDPEFVRKYDKKIAQELLYYTRRVAPEEQGCPSNEDEELEIVVCSATHVMDAISEANREYMKTGMKLGAGLLFQLLGK